MIVHRCPLSILISISDPLESVPQLNEYLLFIGSLLAPANVDFIGRPVCRIRIKVDICVVLLKPVICLFVLHTHVPLLNDDNKDVHDNAR